MADFTREAIETAWRHRMELQDADDWRAFGMTFTEDGDPVKCAVIVRISEKGEFEFYKSVCP